MILVFAVLGALGLILIPFIYTRWMVRNGSLSAFDFWMGTLCVLILVDIAPLLVFMYYLAFTSHFSSFGEVEVTQAKMLYAYWEDNWKYYSVAGILMASVFWKEHKSLRA